MVNSLELEKHVLAGLLKHQMSAYSDIASFIDKNDFDFPINKNIFSQLKIAFERRESVDHIIISERISDADISFEDDLNVSDYIEGLSYIQVTNDTLKQASKDLKIVALRRDFAQACENIKKELIKNKSMSYEEVLSFIDKKINIKMNSLVNSADTQDIFEGIYDLVDQEGELEEIGIPTPYPTFNNLYGGLQNGSVSVFCARPANGKTSFLDFTAFEMGNLISPVKIPILVLDTEMQTDAIRYRVFSALTGINPWYLKTRQYRKYPDLIKRVKKAGELIKKNGYSMHHEYIPGLGIDDVIRKIKRWYYTKVGRGQQCIIVYDYLKVNDNVDQANQEYQVIGRNLTKLKDLVGGEVKAPLLTAMQINRAGENRRSGGVQDDSSVIAASDRIQWFADYTAIFRKKTIEELDIEKGFGTHKLITLKEREQGANAKGHDTLIRDNDGKLVNNFINFKLENFKVEEICSGSKMYASLRGQLDRSGEKDEDDANEVLNIKL